MNTHKTLFATALVSLTIALTTGCVGTMGVTSDAESESSDTAQCAECVDQMLEDAELSPPTTMGFRRLTNFEYDNTITDLLGHDIRPASTLADPTGSTYGNAAEMQSPSSTLIAAAETLALQTSDMALADVATAEPILGCEPTGPGDRACLEHFIRGFGERALRRPLADSEVDELLLFADLSEEAGDFLHGARMVMRVFLQHAEFLYRIEAGSLAAGHDDLYILDDHEIASRMAYLLWGSAPDDELLAAAQSGDLSTPDGRRAQAERMIDGGDDERARALRRIQHFHALWFGYHTAQLGGIAADARTESDALIERVVFDRRAPWLGIFTWEETFVTADLATHYGLGTDVDEPTWVPYQGDRAGILSHATFLNTGTKVGITSPTIRGLHIYERLFCGHVPPPPPTLDIDDSQISKCGEDGVCVRPAAAAGMACSTDSDCPEELGCKSEYSAFYMAPREGDSQGCASCHSQMDPIGLGLENYDAQGRFREYEEPKPLEGSGFDQPECKVEGAGLAPGLGEFSGPAELGRLLASNRVIETCALRQYQQFAWGQTQLPSSNDQTIIATYDIFVRNDKDLLATLVDVIADESFAMRRAVEQPDSPELDGARDEPGTQMVELVEGVDYGVMSVEAPTIDGRCDEFQALAPVSFPTLFESYSNSDQTCRFGWNGDASSPRLFGCCDVQDDILDADLTGDQPGGEIWNDDGIAFVIAPPVRQKSDMMIKSEINVNGAVQQGRWPDAQPVDYDGNVERAVTTTASGFTIEFASDFPHRLDGDQTAHCEFRINDRDGASNGWAIAFGERLLRESTWGLCQFVAP